MSRQAPFCESKALFSLRSGSTEGYEGPLLNFEIIEKILACLPARECWRIGTQLSKRFSQWAKSVINVYHCYHLYDRILTRLQTQYRFKNDETELCFHICYTGVVAHRVQENREKLMVPIQSIHVKYPRIIENAIWSYTKYYTVSTYVFEKAIRVIDDAK